MADAIEDKLREYMMEEMGLDRIPLDDEALVDRGFVASARLLDLVGFLESEFSVELRPKDISADNLASIASIAKMVRGRQSGT